MIVNRFVLREFGVALRKISGNYGIRALQISASRLDLASTADFKKLETAKPTIDKSDNKEQEYKEIVERVRVMNEYFSQYVEEYYEEEAEFGEEEEAAFSKPTKEERIQALAKLYEYRMTLPSIENLALEELVEFLRQQRVKDIVCLRRPIEDGHPNEFVTICTAQNPLHVRAVIINVRKYIKENYRFPNNNQLPPRVRNGPAPEWYNIDLRSVMLHMLTRKARRHYDLESLIGIGDDGKTYVDKDETLVEGMRLGVDSEFLPQPQLKMNTV